MTIYPPYENTEVRQKLLACVNDDEAVSERQLLERLARPPHAITDTEEARMVISMAHMGGDIRWIAYRGWIRGGRP